MKGCSLMSLDRTHLTIRLPKTGKIEMKKRNQALSIITATLLCLSVAPQSATANWYIDRLLIDGDSATANRMLGEDLLQVRSDVYYKVDVAQIESTPQAAGITPAPVEIRTVKSTQESVVPAAAPEKLD